MSDLASSLPPAASRPVWRVSEELLKYYRADGRLYLSGQLRIVAAVANLHPIQSVGIRYTLDHWSSFLETDGHWSCHCDDTNYDQFVILSPSTLPPGCVILYAIYCKSIGSAWLDDNNGNYYSAQF